MTRRSLTRERFELGVLVVEAADLPAFARIVALHAALGFAEVGRASIDGGKKTVRYLSLSLGSEPKRAPAPAPR